MPSKEPMKCLDVGSGEGFLLSALCRLCELPVGIDVSENAVKLMKSRTRHAHVVRSDVQALPFREESFDIVWALDVLEHIAVPRDALKELSRVAEKKSLVVIRVPNVGSAGRLLKRRSWFGYRDFTHKSLLSCKKWIQLLKQFELIPQTIVYDGMWDSPYLPHLPAFVQHLILRIPSVGLFALGFNFPSEFGEDMCVVARKDREPGRRRT